MFVAGGALLLHLTPPPTCRRRCLESDRTRCVLSKVVDCMLAGMRSILDQAKDADLVAPMRP